MKKNIVIGLTGPTGAGKSTICSYLIDKGVKVIDADNVGRNVINENHNCRNELSSYFGADILDESLKINRKILASMAFSSSEQTQILNKITHPYIVNKIKKIISALSSNGAETIIIDAALLFESGLNLICDKVIAVLSDFNIRKQRIISRDTLTENDAELRLRAQKRDTFYHKADFIIYNNESKENLLSKFSTALSKIQESLNETST